MSEFFEPPPPPPPEPETRYRQPAWVGPPEGTLPGVVALELVLVRTKRVAVCITRLAAYPTGFEFELVTMSAPGENELELDPMLFGPHRPRRQVSEGLSPELLRIGVQFADGSKATNTGGFCHDGEPPNARPILEAADRAQLIFSEERLSDSRSGGQRWATYGPLPQVADDRGGDPDPV